MIPYFSLSEFSLGPLTIQLWGAFVALGFLAALFLSLSEARKKQIDQEIIWDVMTLSLFGMIIGGRLFYALFSSHLSLAVLTDLHGGFNLMGGLILAGILSLIYLRRRRQNIGKIFDVLTPGIIVALICVRIGCLLVNDHIGRPTDLFWGVVFVDGSVRHPIALYHILFLSVIFFMNLKIKNRQKADGFLFFKFCMFYAVCAFIADSFRCDDLSFCDARYGSLTATQWILLTFVFIAPVLRNKYLKPMRRKTAAANIPID